MLGDTVHTYLPWFLTSVCVPFLLIAIPALALLSELQGTIVSPSRNLITFPGGGIAANSVLDYINPMWLTQRLRRYHVPLDEVISIAYFGGSKWDGKRHRHFYKMSVTFPFGVATFNFGGNMTKRDQLYDILRNVNQMGTPVFEA